MAAKYVFVVTIFIASIAITALAQDANRGVNTAMLPNAPGVQQQTTSGTSVPYGNFYSSNDIQSSGQVLPPSKQQPKRILGIMPNYRAVSAGAAAVPPTPKQSFMMATNNSFDYSAFIFVGLTSLIAEGGDSHPQLGKGIGGFWAYSWRGFVDKTDGNYLVLFALPSLFHQDERYFTLGEGGIWKRTVYSLSSVVIARNYHGAKVFNTSELLGRGLAEGISTTYYPSQTQTFGAVATKYGYAVMRDGLTNAFREFWPDIAVHVLRRHP